MQVFTGNGRVTSIPQNQKFVTTNGKSQFKFDIAIDSSYKDGDSGYLTTFFHVQTYGKQAELCGSVLSVGSPVIIKGEIVDRPYVNDDGEKRTYRFLNADVNRGITFMEDREAGLLRKKTRQKQQAQQNQDPNPFPSDPTPPPAPNDYGGFGGYTNQ